MNVLCTLGEYVNCTVANLYSALILRCPLFFRSLSLSLSLSLSVFLSFFVILQLLLARAQ